MSGAADAGRISRDPGGQDGPDVSGFVGTRWITLLTLANLGLWMALFTPVQVLLPDQVAGIDEAHKVSMLGIVSAIGGAIALVGAPLAGALSDRTASRYGRRHPWTLGGALVTAGALLALAEQDTIAGVAICWGLAQLAMNAVLAALTAAVPDHVPVPQRGTVSGWLGLPQCIGVVVGTVLVTTAFTSQRAGYAVLAVALVVLVLPFVLGTDDPAHPRAEREAPAWSGFAAGAWAALQAPPGLRVGARHPLPRHARQRPRDHVPALLPRGRGRRRRPRARAAGPGARLQPRGAVLGGAGRHGQRPGRPAQAVRRGLGCGDGTGGRPACRRADDAGGGRRRRAPGAGLRALPRRRLRADHAGAAAPGVLRPRPGRAQHRRRGTRSCSPPPWLRWWSTSSAATRCCTCSPPAVTLAGGLLVRRIKAVP